VWVLAFYGPKGDGTWGEIRRSADTEDEQVAQRRLEKSLREVANDGDGISDFESPAHKRYTIGEALTDLLAFYRRQEIKGLDRVEYKISEGSALWEAFAKRRVCDLTTSDVDRYIDQRRTAKKANATINREVELLRRSLRLALERKRIIRMPSMPEKLRERKREGFFEHEEFKKLLPYLPAPLDVVSRFGYLTGWRRGEVLGLTWSMVDRDAGEIRLPDSKNGKPRTLPLDEELAALIEERWRARQFLRAGGAALSAFVFHRNGKPINKNVFGRQWRKACLEAKVAGKLFHDLRRTAARNMIRGGVAQTVAMKITGHETDAMFRRYDITSSEDKLDALRRARAYTEASRPAASNVREIKR